MIAQIRSFNRTVTQRIGALYDEFLARDRPLGHARVLWEVGTNGCDVRLLRSRLDLDSGYLSRILRALENDGLVELERSGADGRVRILRLTAVGSAEVAELDRRSDRAALAILEPLTEEQRARLAGAMAEVRRLLIASMVSIGPADPRSPRSAFVLACLLRRAITSLPRRFRPGAQYVPLRTNS